MKSGRLRVHQKHRADPQWPGTRSEFWNTHDLAGVQPLAQGSKNDGRRHRAIGLSHRASLEQTDKLDPKWKRN